MFDGSHHLGRSNSPRESAERWADVGKALWTSQKFLNLYALYIPIGPIVCLHHALSIKIKEENIAEEIEFERG